MRYVIMLITFTLSHIYCEVVKRVGSNKHETKFKIAHKESKEDFLRGKFLKSVLNATEKGKVEIWDASKVVPINDSCFCLNDNYSFADGSQNSKANFGNKEVGKFMANLFIEIIIKSERVLS